MPAELYWCGGLLTLAVIFRYKGVSDDKKTNKRLALLCLAGALLAFLIRFEFVYSGGFDHDRNRGDAAACRTNLKNLSTALELYSTDFPGYPVELERLAPEYVRSLPTCPSGGNAYTYERVGEDDYLIFCPGRNHGKVGYAEDHPRLEGKSGIIYTKPGEPYQQNAPR